MKCKVIQLIRCGATSCLDPLLNKVAKKVSKATTDVNSLPFKVNKTFPRCLSKTLTTYNKIKY